MIRETVPLPIPSSFRPGNLLHWIPGRLGTKTRKKHQPPIANAPEGWDYEKVVVSGVLEGGRFNFISRDGYDEYLRRTGRREKMAEEKKPWFLDEEYLRTASDKMKILAKYARSQWEWEHMSEEEKRKKLELMDRQDEELRKLGMLGPYTLKALEERKKAQSSSSDEAPPFDEDKNANGTIIL